MLLVSVPRVWAEPPFWDATPPARWTPEQKKRLLNDSPWAKTVQAETVRAATSRPLSSQPAAGGRVGSGPFGVPIHPAEQPNAGGGPVAFYGKAVVRWENSRPIREASWVICRHSSLAGSRSAFMGCRKRF